MNLKDSIYNVSKIHKRLTGIERTKLHFFANGLNGHLKKTELKQLKDVLTSEYKSVISTINNQLSQQSKTK